MVEGAVQSVWSSLSNIVTGGIGMGGGLLDVILLGVIGFGAIRGYMRGGVAQIGSLLGYAAGIWMGSRHASAGAAVIENYVRVPSGLEMAVGFLVVFAVVQLGVRGTSMAVGHVIEMAGLTSANRAAGGAFGAFKAALVASILLTVGGEVGIPDRQARAESKWYQPVQQTLPITWDILNSMIPEVGQLSEVKRNLLGEIERIGSLSTIVERRSQISKQGSEKAGVSIAVGGKPLSNRSRREKTRARPNRKKKGQSVRVRRAGPWALSGIGRQLEQAIGQVDVEEWIDQMEAQR